MDITVAAVEIKNTSFKLLIGYLYDNKINVLYKRIYPLRVSNKDGDIFDLTSLSEDLKQIKVISDPKKRLRVDINEVVLILPPFGLKVFSNEKTTNTISSDGRIAKIDIANALSMIKKARTNEPNDEIVDIIPYVFSLEGNRVYKDPPLGYFSNSLLVSAHIFTLPKVMVENFKKAITDAGILIKRVVVAPLGVNSLLEINKSSFDKYLLVDYNKDNTTVSFFGNGRLYDSTSFPNGGNDITNAIANSFEISMDKAEELKIIYGHDLRETKFNAPILSVLGDDGIKRKYNKNELVQVVDECLNNWDKLFTNSINYLLKDYGNLKEDIPLVFIGNGTLLNGFKEFVNRLHSSNPIKFFTNDSIGALEPGDINLLGAIAFTSVYKGSLEDETKIDIKPIERKVEEYREDEDDL